jgi:4-alpha-glucanotransferase
MNMPGRASGNWSWRFTDGAITELHVTGLRDLVETYGRAPARQRGQTAIDGPTG